MTCIMNEDKLQEIEIALAYQDQQLQELNTVITDQWKQMELLKARLDKALSKIDRLEGGGDDGDASLSSIERAAQDRPPHY
ncbi:MAG: slyX family protein [Alphaproteobacteria bacterium]|nr:MAG: slyX family protein [Alphaproteobacteria bacterium]